MAGHAGTVPLELRNDALCAAAEMITTIEAYVKAQGIVATVGKCDIKGGAVNVIPGDVQFSIDIRSQNQELLENMFYPPEKLKSSMQRKGIGAGSGNRTRIISLEG
nr:peptidase dimerization domain-containing protein [Vibrio sp. HA2012]